VNDGTTARRWSAMRWPVIGCMAILAVPAIARGGGLLQPQLEVSTRGLCIEGNVFRKTIAISDLQVPLARVVDLDQQPSLRPWIKIYGVGLPFYRSGWFLLKDREKALLLLRRTTRVVYIPTTRGYALLLSPERPAEFLGALQRPSATARVFSIEKTP
jgi:hypothetical protein